MTSLLAACQTIPLPLQTEADDVAPWVVANHQETGQIVRWGGTVLTVEASHNLTCLEIDSRPLAANAQPRDIGYSDGRFVACHDEELDQDKIQGRDITITGEVVDFEQRGGEDAEPLRLPVVAADALFIWPPQQQVSLFGPAAIGWATIFLGGGYSDPYFHDPHHPPSQPPSGGNPQPQASPTPRMERQPVEIKRQK